MKKDILFSLPAIAYLIFCTVLLTLPGTAFPQENWFDSIHLDKLIHIGMFSGMVVIICWSLFKIKGKEKVSRSLFIWIGIACFSYGVGMEFVQKYFVINRSFDTGDILADGVGAAIGTIFSCKVYIKK